MANTFEQKKFLDQSGVSTLWSRIMDKLEGENGLKSLIEAEAERAAAAELVNANAIAAEAARADAAEKVNAKAIADEVTRATAAEAQALADAKTYADEVKKSILTGDSTAELKEAYDTLVEIQAWIEGDGVNATELADEVAKLAKSISDEVARAEGKEAELGTAIGALEAKTVLGSDAEGNEYATVKAYVEAMVAAVNSGSTEALEQAVADLTAAIATAKGEAATDATNKANAAEAAAKAYADGINTDLDARLDVLEADPVTKTAAEAYTDAECAKVYAAIVALEEADIDAAIANA